MKILAKGLIKADEVNKGLGLYLKQFIFNLHTETVRYNKVVLCVKFIPSE